MPDFISNIASDNIRVARSKTLYELADGTYNIIMLPRKSLVLKTIFHVDQAYAGGANGAVTIGYGSTADGLMAAATSLARATGTKISTTSIWFDTAGSFVTVTLSKGTDTTLLRAFVFVVYSVIH